MSVLKGREPARFPNPNCGIFQLEGFTAATERALIAGVLSGRIRDRPFYPGFRFASPWALCFGRIAAKTSLRASLACRCCTNLGVLDWAKPTS